METTLDLKMIGMYSINKVAPDKVNCSNCGNADWGDVLIEGICGRCLHQAWQAAQQSRAVDLPNESLCICGKPIKDYQGVVCLPESASQ